MKLSKYYILTIVDRFGRVEEESVEAWLKHHGLENDARTPPNFRTELGKNKENWVRRNTILFGIYVIQTSTERELNNHPQREGRCTTAQCIDSDDVDLGAVDGQKQVVWVRG
jgi:hypothetical protein